MHQNSKLIFENYAKKYFQPGMRVLEIGPDGIPSSYQRVFSKDSIKCWKDSIQWDTLDLYENPKLTYTAREEYSFPIADAIYDIALSGNVLEHVRKPWIWIKEVTRICRKGGLVITIAPVSWPYHEAPVDCWRAYPEGMKALYEEAGLDVIESTFDSLEVPNYRRYIPGMSPEWQGWKRRITNQLLGKLGFPVERAYDVITIGKKTQNCAFQEMTTVSTG
jgi:SAM-dependent methyltransferase